MIGTLAQGKRGDGRWEIGDATLIQEWRPESAIKRQREEKHPLLENKKSY